MNKTEQEILKEFEKIGLEVIENDEILTCSSENTLSRISKTYRNEYCRRLSGHIAYSYAYDMTKEDNWINGDLIDFKKSIIVDQDLPMNPHK